MLPKARVTHRTPTRFRVKIPASRGNSVLMERLHQQISRCDQVNSVKSNPVTGTLLISHRGDMDEVLAYAEKKLIFTLLDENLKGITEVTLKAYRVLDQGVKTLSGGKLDLPHTAFLTFIGTGLYQLLRGPITAPTWHNAFWYAMNVFLKAEAARAKAQIR